MGRQNVFKVRDIGYISMLLNIVFPAVWNKYSSYIHIKKLPVFNL